MADFYSITLTADQLDRFWGQVEKTETCWIWRGLRNPRGYGIFSHRGKNWPAHRASWVLAGKSLIVGQLVCHDCDNPPCVRPDHLFAGTHEDNMADMRRKQRSNRGVKHGCAKLDESRVREIRRLMAGGAKQVDVARAFGIDPANVFLIRHRKTWTHVS